MTVIKSTEYVDLENTRDSKMKMKEEDKDMDNQFEWVEFYKAFAEELLQYKDKRNELIQIIRKVYEEIDINLPTLEKDNQIVDIDPFTVFGLFNKSSMKESNKIKIISALAKELSIEANIPTSFDSVPTLNNQNATFYYWVDVRGAEDIDNLWRLFECALEYANNPFEMQKSKMAQYFDIAINMKGNGNSKITMALYWIAPETFLNLDSRNTWYIYESGEIPQNIVNALPTIEPKIPSEKYFDVIEKLRGYLESKEYRFKNFKELSAEAWKYSQEVNDAKKALGKIDNNVGEALADQDVRPVHYWLYSPGEGASKWEEFCKEGIMSVKWQDGDIGDLSQYSSHSDIKNAMKMIHADWSHKLTSLFLWQFYGEVMPGDVIFAKKGTSTVLGKGVVTSEYIYDEDAIDGYCNIRKVDWTDVGEWTHPGNAATKILTDVTNYTEYVNQLLELFVKEETEESKEVEHTYPPYTREDFLNDVFMREDEYSKLVNILKIKKNIILQGAPGVGKTFAAKRIAYSIMGEKDIERVMMVQFHQSYSYEDFIMGFRPVTGGGFDLKKGAFYNFCKKAEEDKENDYFFIIDEINRGNISKIFGELFMLIENDKRGISMQLLYSDEKFAVPKNVYIIGMMNTADRSLAMLDYALRRRFAFIEMKPGFDTDGFNEYAAELNNESFNKLILCKKDLNGVIASDESLGEGFQIGHSYFCNLSQESISKETMESIVEYELIPMLKEYWFDEPSKVSMWSDNLRRAIK